MKNWIRITAALGSLALVTAGGFAVAQMDGPQPPDGPMQGPMRGHGRTMDRFRNAFDLNHDGKVTRDEVNKADATIFASATRGGNSMSPDQFAAIHTQQNQQHAIQMFRRLDWSGDGKLSFDEYAAPLRVRFETMDRDGSGTESCNGGIADHASSRPNAKKAFGRGFGRARFCADNDLNRDGKVTHAEFDSATAKNFGSLAAGAKIMSEAQFAADALAHYRDLGSRMFRRLDQNKDGKVAFGEFVAPDQKLFAKMDQNKDGAVTRDELSARGFRGGVRKRAPSRG